MTGAELIAAERKRQIDDEGWSESHDDRHRQGELIAAAECYMVYGCAARFQNSAPMLWPWNDRWWKPVFHDKIRNLVKAGALIAAEIDRLKRCDRQEQPALVVAPCGHTAADHCDCNIPDGES